MQPQLMRRIDFWLGIPICFFLTVVERLLRLVKPARSTSSEPRRVLFIQLAEMGTTVVMYPAMRKAKELFPDARFYFLAFAEIQASVELVEAVAPENILTIGSRSFGLLTRDTIKFLWAARHHKIDTTINFESFSRYSTILGFLSGASRRVGFHRFNQEGAYTGDLLTHHVWYNANIHAGHTFLDLVHALKAPPDQVPLVKRPRAEDDLSVPKLTADAPAREHVWKMLQDRHEGIDPSKKLVVLNPNASRRLPMRRLPLESFADVARRLLEDPSVYVLIIGVESEKPDADYIRRRLDSPRALDLTGATTLRQLVDLFLIADVLLTNDSGPAHFASLTNLPVVVCFGPEMPDRYKPLTHNCHVVYADYTCSPCLSPFNQRATPCNENLCLKNMPVDMVYRAVKACLDGRVETAAP